MLNADQAAYCESLSGMPPEGKCWCGWYAIGTCPNCPAGKTLADRVAVECPNCHNAPPPDGSAPIVHIRGCSVETPEERAYYAAVMARAAPVFTPGPDAPWEEPRYFGRK